MMIYLAAPLFTAAEREYNLKLSSHLQLATLGNLAVFLPQSIDGSEARTTKEIYRTCIERLGLSDLVLAILDGSDADSGTCFEVGFAVAKGKPVVGLRTDFRPGGDDGPSNLMLTNGCRYVVNAPTLAYSFDDTVNALIAAIEQWGGSRG